jgi:endonuclease/exonuclease/phosphatase family metal-dependent hydrolase
MSNAVLSRTPFIDVDRRELPTTDFWPAPRSARNVVHVRTNVPGVGVVNVFVTHPWGWSDVDGPAQVDVAKAFLVEKRRGDEALELVIGDLNAPPSSTVFQRWLSGAVALVDAFALSHPGSTASTVFGEDNRIDYVLVGAGASVPSSSNLVFDGVDGPRVSDHIGVQTAFTFP